MKLETENNKKAEAFLKKTKTTIDISTKVRVIESPDGKEIRTEYLIGLGRNSTRLCYIFGYTVKSSKIHGLPTNYDILRCLPLDDFGTFQDFCKKYELYFEDIKAKDIYRENKWEYTYAQILFQEKELKMLRELQQGEKHVKQKQS